MMEEAERLSDDIQMIADRIESIYRRKDTLVGSQSKGEDDGTMKEVEDIVHLLKSHPFLQSSQPQERGVLQYLLGKALVVLPEATEEAAHHLEAAIKLRPYNVDAWNCLADHYWQRGDIFHARQCFECALSHGENKESMRQLSMVLRQTGETPEERHANIKDSLEKAKRAVAFDIEDGVSWYILGNTYLAIYFVISHEEGDLEKSLKAYHKAETLKSSISDLHYNQAVAYKHKGGYQHAIENFRKATAMDSSWAAEVRKEEQEITSYLEGIATAVTEEQNILSRGSSAPPPDMKDYVAPTKFHGWVVRVVNPAPTSILPSVLVVEDTASRCVVVPLRGCAPSQTFASRSKIEILGARYFMAQHAVDDKVWRFPVLQAAHLNKVSINSRQLQPSFPIFQMNRK